MAEVRQITAFTLWSEKSASFFSDFGTSRVRTRSFIVTEKMNFTAHSLWSVNTNKIHNYKFPYSQRTCAWIFDDFIGYSSICMIWIVLSFFLLLKILRNVQIKKKLDKSKTACIYKTFDIPGRKPIQETQAQRAYTW